MSIPNDPKSEQAIISVLVGGYCMESYIFAELEDRDFFTIGFREMFIAAKAVYDEGKEVDIVTVSTQLSITGRLELAGNFGALTAQNDGTLRGVKAYIDRLKEVRALHDLQGVKDKLDNLIRCGTAGSEEIIRATIDDMNNIAVGTTGEDDIHKTMDMGPQVIADLKRKEQNTDVNLSTGYPDLDAKIPGWSSGHFYVLAGRPGSGKTSLMMEHVRYAAATGVSVAVFSLEMPRDQLFTRHITMRTSYGIRRLNEPGQKSEGEWSRILEAVDEYSNIPINIIDKPKLTVGNVMAMSQKIKHEDGLGLICIDYLQLLRSGSKHGSREEEVAAISRELKESAKALEVPVLCLAQLNRKVEERTVKKPIMSDLRESGAIEQDADMVSFLYRDSMYNNTANDSDAELIIAKNRHGSTGTIELHWHPERMLFSSKETHRDEPTREEPPLPNYQDFGHPHWND